MTYSDVSKFTFIFGSSLNTGKWKFIIVYLGLCMYLLAVVAFFQ
jgi:hypothetical protein